MRPSLTFNAPSQEGACAPANYTTASSQTPARTNRKQYEEFPLATTCRQEAVANVATVANFRGRTTMNGGQ